MHYRLNARLAWDTTGEAVFIQSKQARREMAIDSSKGHPAMDYAEHNRTYLGFLRGAVVLVVLCAMILIGMLVALT